MKLIRVEVHLIPQYKSFTGLIINPHTPIRFTPHTPVAQKIVDQRRVIAKSAKKVPFFYKK